MEVKVTGRELYDVLVALDELQEIYRKQGRKQEVKRIRKLIERLVEKFNVIMTERE